MDWYQERAMKRDLGLERAWRQRIRRYERSGLTIAQFCEQEGLAVHQLYWWRRELKQRGAEAGPASKGGTNRRKRGRRARREVTTDFVPVHVTASRETRAPIEIVLDQPLRIAVASGFDAESLAQVVRVLEAR